MTQQNLTSKILNAQFRIAAGSRETDYLKPKLKSWIKERTELRQAEIDNGRKTRKDKK